MAEIDLEGVFSVLLKNLPSVERQQAVLDEVERLKLTGLTEEQAIRLVFDNNTY